MSASSKPHPGGSNSIVVSRAVFFKSEDIVGAVFIKSEDIVGSCLLAENPTQAVLNNINFRWAVYC